VRIDTLLVDSDTRDPGVLSGHVSASRAVLCFYARSSPNTKHHSKCVHRYMIVLSLFVLLACRSSSGHVARFGLLRHTKEI